MARIDLDPPYLWPAKGRGGRLYWFYRRDGHRVPTTSPDGKRLFPGDVGFMESYERIHASFEAEKTNLGPGSRIIPGSLGHAIPLFLADPETAALSGNTQYSYRRYLNELLNPRREGELSHGHRPLASLPPEAIRKLRDDRKDMPWTANARLGAIGAFLSWVEGRPLLFQLPPGWRNPASTVKPLKTPDGHRPWEEYEIDQFYKKCPPHTRPRVVLDLFLYTGQRGGDVAGMMRQHYHEGAIAVLQEKTKERVWIPAARRLKDVLDPWMASHAHAAIIPRDDGQPMSQREIGKMMRAAMDEAGLPKDCKLHGLRYTFATRMIELGLDYQTLESIVGHKTMAMAIKYTQQRRRARLAISALNRFEDGNSGLAAQD